VIAPTEALETVLARAPRLAPAEVLLLDGLGAVLAETVLSDLDLPPFNKSAMDGFAVRSADLAALPADLDVVEDLPAGVAPTRPLVRGMCARIMTGAPVPAGADTVVRVEYTEMLLDRRVRVLRAEPPGANICARGEDVRRGAAVLEPGHVLGPAEAGLLASVGRERVAVYRRPRVAVLATGDELVPASAVPGPGRIRDANSWGLLAACRRAGVPAEPLGIARDTEADLAARVAAGLARDVLVVSGGVSMGEWDLVPKVLEAAGVTTHFAAVRMKPGKPTVFATRGQTLVFGLPGNPVSTLVAFRLLVWPALRKMMGHPRPAPPPVEAVLAGPVVVGGDRTTFLPARLAWDGRRWVAEAVPTHGSADLVAFASADALVVLEPGRYDAGAPVPALPLDPDRA